jgi:hypothetical protein
LKKKKPLKILFLKILGTGVFEKQKNNNRKAITNISNDVAL